MKNNQGDYTLSQEQLSNPNFIFTNLLPWALGCSIASQMYYGINNPPAKIRDFMYKKRPFPTDNEFADFLKENNLHLTAEPNENDLVFTMAGPNAILGQAELDDLPTQRIKYEGDFNCLRLVPILEFELKDSSNYHKIFEQVLDIWRKGTFTSGVDVNYEVLYQGYLNMMKLLTRKRQQPFAKYLTREEMSVNKKTSNMMTVSRLIEKPNGKFAEDTDWSGEFKDNFDEALDDIKRAKKQNMSFYMPFKVFIYHSMFEPDIKLTGNDYAKFDLVPDELVNINGADGKGLNIDNPVVIYAKDKKTADKEYRDWAKYRGYYSKDNLTGTTTKISK